MWYRGHLVNTVKTTDEALMQRFQNGDRDVFEVLYQRYKAPIFTFLVRQYTSNDNANEITQEVFIRVIRNASSFRHGSKFATWIFAIARNLAIDFLRKAKHRAHASLDQQIGGNGPTLGDRLPGNSPNPDKASTQSTLRDDITRALSKLPDDQREVFLLREYHGLPFREIATVVNAKEGTVKSRMRYALETLRNELAHHADYARTLP
jgi:RNA polymerase sigma-70 factor (ECF subfamily)